VAVEAVTSAAARTHNSSELSMLRMAARAAVMYALQAQEPTGDSLQQHTTQELRAASVAQPGQAAYRSGTAKHARKLHIWGGRLPKDSDGSSQATGQPPAGLLQLLAHQLSLQLQKGKEESRKKAPAAGGLQRGEGPEEVVDAQEVASLLQGTISEHVTPDHILHMAHVARQRHGPERDERQNGVRGSNNNAGGQRRLKAQHETELPGGIHPGSTIYGHSTQLGECVRASLRAGQYKPHVDQATLVCSQLLPWWQIQGA
jgi:hypothetical protein